jgi:two-component system chemotaxis response regulator CheY
MMILFHFAYGGEVIVLLVDDAPIVRARMAALLLDVPGVVDVIEAAGAADAVTVLRLLRPDIVVLDVHLRGTSGLTLAPLVRQEQPTALLILVTNEPTTRHRQEGLARGADHFFDKSRQFEDVVRVVTAWALAPPPTPPVLSSDA